jgi:hypothetical protein
VPASISTATARPSAWVSAVSKDSARRWRASARTLRRSTTTSMRVLAVPGELRQGVDVVHRAVDPQAHEALGAQFGEQIELLALAAGHHRGEDHQFGVFRQGQHVVHHLRDALRLERLAVLRAVRRAGAGEEQAQVVVDLGDGADRRARVVAGGLLLDGDGRRQALDQVDVGLLHQLQELPRVGRERLDVAALALGVERVEGERGLLPEPDRPVITVSRLRGRSRLRFFRLCVRAPRMRISSMGLQGAKGNLLIYAIPAPQAKHVSCLPALSKTTPTA